MRVRGNAACPCLLQSSRFTTTARHPGCLPVPASMARVTSVARHSDENRSPGDEMREGSALPGLIPHCVFPGRIHRVGTEMPGAFCPGPRIESGVTGCGGGVGGGMWFCWLWLAYLGESPSKPHASQHFLVVSVVRAYHYRPSLRLLSRACFHGLGHLCGPSLRLLSRACFHSPGHLCRPSSRLLSRACFHSPGQLCGPSLRRESGLGPFHQGRE
jgi:hypothetical protein